jgi:hypothetical protein
VAHGGRQVDNDLMDFHDYKPPTKNPGSALEGHEAGLVESPINPSREMPPPRGGLRAVYGTVGRRFSFPRDCWLYGSKPEGSFVK